MNFAISKDLRNELKIMAARESRKMAEIIIEQIENYIKVHKEGNPQHLLTAYTDNEDFMGFPAMAISDQNKRIYLQKMPEDMREQMMFHLQSWSAFLKEL